MPLPVKLVGSDVNAELIGTVGYEVAIIQPTMGTQTNGAYSANDTIGGILTLSNAVRQAGAPGIILQVGVHSKSVQTGNLDVLFFKATPSNSTVADNGALAIDDADGAKLIGVVHLDDVTSLGLGSYHQGGTNLPFIPTSGVDIFAIIVDRTGMTLTSTSDITLIVRIVQG